MTEQKKDRMPRCQDDRMTGCRITRRPDDKMQDAGLLDDSIRGQMKT